MSVAMNREEFDELNLEEQERIFHQSPFREKGELLLRSHNPVRLAQSLSHEELYLVTREMDLEERGEIIRYASLPQLFFLSDIDCWKGDRVNREGFRLWLETLEKSDEQKLLAWLLAMDYETVVSGLKGLIRVMKPEREYAFDELLRDSPYFTLDEQYFILVEEENIETVRRAIEILYENHRGRYAAILEGILGELDYEVEEEAYRKREMRLADRGFPDPATARQIYRPLTKKEYDEFPRKNLNPGRREGEFEGPAPDYPLLWSPERFFLDDVFLSLREESREVQEQVQEELAWLSNKVIACEGIDFASEERVRRGVERARRFVNIGLELLSGRDLLRAREILRERWLELIFRGGVSRLIEVRERAAEIPRSRWGSSQKLFLGFLDPPYEFIFRGLLKTVPEAYDPEVRDHVDSLRDFKTTDEVTKTERAVLQVEKLHELLDRRFPALFHRLNIEARRNGTSPSLFALLGSAFGSFVLTGKPSCRPLSNEEAREFLKRGFERQGSRVVLNQAFKETFLSQFLSTSDAELLRPFWATVFERLQGELAGVHPERGIDPRFVTALSLVPDLAARQAGTKVPGLD